MISRALVTRARDEGVGSVSHVSHGQSSQLKPESIHRVRSLRGLVMRGDEGRIKAHYARVKLSHVRSLADG